MNRLTDRACSLLAVVLAASTWLPAPADAASTWLRAPADAASRATYVIRPGDELSIRFFHTPELDVDLPVRPDGRISLPLASSVQAAGRTPEELADELAARLASELRDPAIAVVVRTFTAQVVHVGGEVRRAGVVPLTDGLTLLQAITEAGGLLDTGKRKQVILIRGSGSGAPVARSVDLRPVLTGEDPGSNVPLEPQDIVYVPRTRIANVNRFMQQYLWENFPVVIRFAIN
jgi:protein involved in polysaccharide export with SLBB domain